MYYTWYKNLSTRVKYVLIASSCPANRFEWYNGVILYAHVSGTASNAVFLHVLFFNLNSDESNKMPLSAKASTFLWLL